MIDYSTNHPNVLSRWKVNSHLLLHDGDLKPISGSNNEETSISLAGEPGDCKECEGRYA